MADEVDTDRAPFVATFSGADLKKLTAALLDAAPYASEPPDTMQFKWVERPVAKDWREQMLADNVDGLSARWGSHRIGRNESATTAEFPGVPLDANAITAFVSALPFELAVMPMLHDEWTGRDYFPPTLSPDHASLGWGMIVHGTGHEQWFVSRRWLEQAPARIVNGPNETTLVQFHDLAADSETALEQARSGHAWIAAGALRPKHRFKHDIKGVYTQADGLLRIVINDRSLTDAELNDACAARRDGRNDREKPIKNIAYVFVDEASANKHLEPLWLRELECRVVTPLGERRIDEGYIPKRKQAAWVK